MSKIALSAPSAGNGMATIHGPELTSDINFTLPELGGELLTGIAPVVYQLNGGQLAGHRNKLINPFSENQRVLTSVADDTYCLDRWYVLSGSGNITVAQVEDPEPGAPFGIRLTQPDATSNRFGLAQIIESHNIRQYAGQAMNLFARVKLSTGGAIRFAILEHSGTADVVISDVVNTWTSPTFTPSNFFIAGINVLKTGAITPGAATWGSIDDWSVLSSNVKNIVIFFWTEDVLAQNGTLELNRPQYEPGVIATPHEWRMNELSICQQYYENIIYTPSNAAAISSVHVSVFNYFQWNFKQTKRAPPAVSLANGAWINTTPTVTSNIHGAEFRNVTAHFYASGTPGAIGPQAIAEL